MTEWAGGIDVEVHLACASRTRDEIKIDMHGRVVAADELAYPWHTFACEDRLRGNALFVVQWAKREGESVHAGEVGGVLEALVGRRKGRSSVGTYRMSGTSRTEADGAVAAGRE